MFVVATCTALGTPSHSYEETSAFIVVTKSRFLSLVTQSPCNHVNACWNNLNMRVPEQCQKLNNAYGMQSLCVSFKDSPD